MKTLIALICFLFMPYCFAGSEDVNVGAYVINADSHKLIYSKHPTRSFMPASTMKLFVAVSALDYLHPDFRYQTLLKEKEGNYYLNFSGDPSLNQQTLLKLLKKLPKTINGDLILDNTVFDNKPHAQGVTWDEENICYAAPTTSITLNGNCERFTVTAGEFNTPATHSLPDNSGLLLNNTAIASNKPGCTLDLASNDNNEYSLSGCMRPHTTLPFAIAIHNPDLYTKQLIQTYLNQLHIVVIGNISYGHTPKNANVIAAHRSEPLSTLVAHMLKTSDSLYANNLLKTLGHLRFHQQGSWFNGIEAIKDILKNSGINFSRLDLFDASGESRYDLATPKQFTELLLYAYQNKTIWTAFKNSLPISNIDGTLRHRLPGFKGKIYAKTGTLKGTSTLSGYLFEGDKTYIFSIMINGGRQDVSAYWKIERNILTNLAG
jgi:D-alanyl-D-alanine carboxypeptidase/D-alanyl-D-alanine-endopeptidase (penicillin-binding protein 4)